jgi:SAM-dependent methyltransferase
LIRERQRYYLPFLAGHAPVLDLGCGRAEMLDLLTEQGIPAQGVDVDEGMVARARAKGHNVIRADALTELESRPAESLGAVFCSHVIEHVSGGAIERLLRGALRALRPGGLLLIETPNPYFPFWLRAFWIDPTHRRPVFPEALLTLCAGVGFAEVLHTHPNGSGHVEVDRFAQPDMTVIAAKANT